MHTTRDPALDLIKEQLTRELVAPSAAVACARRSRDAWKGVCGGDVASVFDLASLTKPMTAMACAHAFGARVHTVTLAAVWPELADTFAADCTLEELLSHRAGLGANLPLFMQERALVEQLRLAANERAERKHADYTHALYSDLSYILAGAMLAREVGACDAGEAIEKLVVARLGLERTLGTARSLAAGNESWLTRVVATEDVAWRGGVVRGAVHDENAWALTGSGASGHAGMFGTARAMLAFATAAHDSIVLNQGPLATKAPLTWMIAPRPGGTERAGFDGKSAQGSSAGDAMGQNAFGHLGFTGTSFWVDPDPTGGAIAVVLLTNRVHPTRDNARIRAARPQVHGLLATRARAII